MSGGRDFWAAGNRTVKSSTSPTPNIAEAPSKPKPATDSHQKKGLVLRSMANGDSSNAVASGFTICSTSNGKKLDWDDEEEDNNFLAQFTTEKQQSINTAQEDKMILKQERIAALEQTVTSRSIRIVELEETAATKVTRIAELEHIVEEKDHEIGDLGVTVQDKDVYIEELKKENYNQFIEIQDLYHEIDENDDLVEKLEVELKQKDATIHTLEQESVRSNRPSTDNSKVMSVETKDTSTTFQEDATKGTDGSDTEMTESTTDAPVSESFEMVDPPKSGDVRSIQTVPDNTGTKAPQDTTVTKPAQGPSFGNFDFPTFSTQDTLKVVPPAPKPKTLSFPMDMSKYGKKGPPVTKRFQASSAASNKGRHSTSWGQSSKQSRVKTNAQPTVNPSKDIRHMPHNERVLYANGPNVIVKIGTVKLMTIPKYVLMQCSAKAMQYFTANPDATSWVFLVGSMDAEAAKAHLNWMEEMTYQGRVYSLTLSTASSHDQKNLRICRAARVLGLNNAYVGHFTKQLCDRIRNQDVSHEFKDAVCELAYPDNDPIFDCLTNNLVTQKKNGNVTDAEGLSKLVGKHPLLKAKMGHIEKRIGSGGRACKSPAGSERGGTKACGGAKGRGSSAAAAVPGCSPVDI